MKRGICLALLSLTLGLTCPALAQAPKMVRVEDAPASKTAGVREPAGYRPLIELALKEYDATRFVAAKAAFHRAYRLFPNARALRGLGMVEFELGNYRASIAHLAVALTSGVRPLDAALRTETELLLARARQLVLLPQAGADI